MARRYSGDRLIEPTLFPQDIAQVVVGLGRVGPQFDRAAEMVNRPIRLPRSTVNLAQIAVIQGDRRVDGDRPADQLDRHLGAAHLAGEDTQ